jgi:hypothetical protein
LPFSRIVPAGATCRQSVWWRVTPSSLAEASPADQILEQCAAHNAIAADSHLSFLPNYYSGRRSGLFLFLDSVPLIPTTRDRASSSARIVRCAPSG